MKNYVKPHQNTIAQSLDYKTAQDSLSMLQKAGFPPEKFSVMPQNLDPNSSFGETEAAKGAGAGALTGAAFGALGGGLIAYATTLSGNLGAGAPNWIGIVLAGSGVGALAVSILGAFTGTNVPKKEGGAPAQQYVLMADVTPDELKQAQTLLQESGISVTPN